MTMKMIVDNVCVGHVVHTPPWGAPGVPGTSTGVREREVVAHLLVVESWVGAMSRLLPRAIREGGHAFTFLTRGLHHYLRSAPQGTAHPLLAARNVLTADTNDVDALLPQAERLHGALGFDGVVTSCDYLPTVARIAGRLGLPGPTPPRPAGNRSTELIRHVTGIDLAAACVEVALGRAPDLRRRETGLRSAAVGFLVPDATGTLDRIDGSEQVRCAQGVLEVQLARPGRAVKTADSNNEYLGHVMAGDAEGLGARARVESLLSGLRPRVTVR